MTSRRSCARCASTWPPATTRWTSPPTAPPALRAAVDSSPDLVILDLGLPDLDGIDVIHGLRGWTTIPIIALSGRAGNQDKIEALDAGADDYVTKPFGIDEICRFRWCL